MRLCHSWTVLRPGDVRAKPARAEERTARGERFTAVMTAITRRLPFGLARTVPPNLLGFAVINSFTFGCDLALLTALHSGLHWPVPRASRCPTGPRRG